MMGITPPGWGEWQWDHTTMAAAQKLSGSGGCANQQLGAGGEDALVDLRRRQVRQNSKPGWLVNFWGLILHYTTWFIEDADWRLGDLTWLPACLGKESKSCTSWNRVLQAMIGVWSFYLYESIAMLAPNVSGVARAQPCLWMNQVGEWPSWS